jgi:hypothetical protein
MQCAGLQRKEASKRPAPEPSPGKLAVVEPENEFTAELGVPLFLQSATLLSTCSPPAIQRQLIEDEEEEEGVVQTKLKVGEPGDKYEQEADNVAEMVMRTPDTAGQSKPT